MKKLLFSTIAATCIGFMASAQAILPATWGFATTTLPASWTATGTDYYSASGNPAPALKFDNAGDKLEINFASAPGALTFDIVGNGNDNPWAGVFTIEESVLGSTWTTVNAYTASLPSSYTGATFTLLNTSRFVRFVYTTKTNGNVGIDNVSIAVGAATPEQEINVKQGTTSIPTGGSYSPSSPVSVMTPTTFTIENLGTADALNIASAVISGPAAADFSVSSATPFTVNANGTGALGVEFTPSVAGTRSAILTIASNDADEASYIINLNGIGGGLATEPDAQPTNLVFSNVKTYRFTGSFTPSTADGFIVLRKKGSAISTGVPVDGEAYDRGDIIGDAQVVFSGTATSFTPNNIIASETYHFAVYSYNGAGTFRNYRTATPLTGSATTPATMMPAGEYTGINTNEATFVAELHAHVNPHQMQYYSNYAALMIAKFAARDTTDNRRVITCVYSGENKIYTEPFDFTSNNFSREHTYAYSWMPTTNQDLPEYNDYHHLFPTNQNQANAVRSNYPFGIVVQQSSSYLQGKFGLDANGNLVYEPRDAHKGDAARALMYEAVAYTTVNGNNWGFPNPISGSINYGQDQSVIKAWHFQDPPDGYEISRNDYLDSLQGNRNPFVDSIDFACFVNFDNMSYSSAGCFASIEEKLSANFMVYPNPAKSVLNLNVDATTISGYEITDMQGRVVLTGDAKNEVLVKINTEELKSGSYLIRVTTPYGQAVRSVVIE